MFYLDTAISNMLVILLGPQCSAKKTIADILSHSQSYTRVHLRSHSSATSDDSALVFKTAPEFLDYATLRWRQHFVCTDLVTNKEINNFRKRPFVLLVSLEAPLFWRYQRSVARFVLLPSSQLLHTSTHSHGRAQTQGEPIPNLETFITQDDFLHFGPSTSSTPLNSTTLQLPSRPINLPHPSPSPPMSRQSSTQNQVERTPLRDLLPLCNLAIRPAQFQNEIELKNHVLALDLSNEKRVRPDWDDYCSS